MALTGAHRMMLGLFLPITACASHRSAPSTPAAAAPAHDRAASVPEEKSWLPKISTGSNRYAIEDSSIVSINADTAKSLPIQSSVVYSLTISGDAAPFHLTATTDSFVISGGAQRRNASAPRNGHLEFSGLLSATSELSAISGGKSADCSGGIDPLGNRLNELVVGFPSSQIEVGSEWTDSTDMIVCRGKTALAQHVVRTWKLMELLTWQGREAAMLERSSTVTVSVRAGSTDHTQVTGSGSGKATVYVDRATGVLVSSTGQSQLTLNVTTSRGMFPIAQSVTSKIQLR